MKEKQPKFKKLKYYKDRAWKQFSRFIRLREAVNGYVECVTCGKVMPWQESQAGHFIPGRNNAILFDDIGCHPQCVGCNFFGRNSRGFGRYYQFMKNRYGLDVIDRLAQQSTKTVIYERDDYMDIEEKYKKLADELEGKCSTKSCQTTSTT